MGDSERPSALRRLIPSRRAAVTAAIRALLAVIPPRRQVLVYGWPDHEGNAVALVRFLARESGERRIVWLVNAPLAPTSASADWLGRVTVRVKRSPAALWAYLRSDVVCFTHGLFHSPEPSRGRVFVNLWHGDGPKRTENPAFAAHHGATAIVGQTRLWGEKKAVELGMPASSMLLVGDPRIDDLVEPMSEAQRQALADRLGSRFLLWMPTYRDSNGAGFEQWSDAAPLSTAGHLAAVAEQAGAAAEAHGVSLVLRAHPMDRDAYAGVPGLLLLDDAVLEQLGVSLYQVLGASSGLITDYSSVWTDYLVLDRPILLFCPDLDEYSATRGFNVPDLRAVAPGALVTHADGVGRFVAEVAQGRDPSRGRRHEVAAQIGAVTEAGASARLWQAIVELRGNGRKRPESVPELVA